jgi:transposase
VAGTTAAAVALIDDLDEPVPGGERELRHLGADHAEGPLLMTAPGIAWSWATRSPPKLGDIARFPSPKKLCGESGLCRGWTSPGRGTIRAAGQERPQVLRWALIEAATHAARHPGDHDQATRRRLGRQRGPAVARVQLARNSPRRSGTCSPPRPGSARQGPGNGSGRMTARN